MRLRTPMPELEGASKWINGKVTRSQLIGEKPTLIHFWSVSCHQCKEAMANVNRICEQYKDQLNVVAVHMPRSEEDTDIKQIKKTAAKFNISHPVFVDNFLKLTDAFNNQFVPAYYVFDKFGVLRHYQSGSRGTKMVETSINRLIQET
ncbi:redoxin domain-containing protein [Lysinibacillus telephonicus]|uniref:Redoxin domain-containing protein n=1 Tax=Lysinibacillus telephonicus TaxID=1714840 RepID=A0A3S0HTK0_9BACI|nr:thioredoxin-like domain-containing protein [Lysinibacillus telephonicus]RTQ86778.1 redoxin domain-containing protein [Lysinibacillus telephonicus]